MNSTIEQRPSCESREPPSGERTDEDLLLEYRERGSRWAFEALVHRYETELYNYLRRYLGDAQMAEDAFQTTFLQVHTKCGQFESGRRVRPWLYTIATNQAIDAQRRNRRHRMISLDRRWADGREDEMGPLAALLDSEEPGPLEQVESAERDVTVRRGVEWLQEPLRQVVTLVYFQGLKYREAAEVLSIPVGTVKSRLHCAIRKLNEALTLDALAGND